jgi:flagellar motility protein MotE (MotC chaperone)
MSIALPRLRLLPATIATMALLLAVKTISFARDAAGQPAVPAAPAASEPPADAAKPAAAAAAAPPPAEAPASPPSPAAMKAASVQPAPVQNAVPPPDPRPISDAERSLLLDLRKRHEALEARAAMLDQREAVQAAAEAKLNARLDQLATLQARLEALEAGRQQHASENWSGLVHVYEDMKPRDAATIFDALDMQVLLQVLDRMQDRKAAPILAAMQPDRARLATQLLAEMRLRAVAPPGAPTPGQAATTHPTDQHS